MNSVSLPTTGAYIDPISLASTQTSPAISQAVRVIDSLSQAISPGYGTDSYPAPGGFGARQPSETFQRMETTQNPNYNDGDTRGFFSSSPQPSAAAVMAPPVQVLTQNEVTGLLRGAIDDLKAFANESNTTNTSSGDAGRIDAAVDILNDAKGSDGFLGIGKGDSKPVSELLSIIQQARAVLLNPTETGPAASM